MVPSTRHITDNELTLREPHPHDYKLGLSDFLPIHIHTEAASIIIYDQNLFLNGESFIVADCCETNSEKWKVKTFVKGGKRSQVHKFHVNGKLCGAHRIEL